MTLPDHDPQDASSNIEQLRRFRAGFYQCLTRWPDAGFELVDAVLSSPAPVGSIPALSLEPVFRRSHGSLYKALARGGIDAAKMRDLLVAHRPADWPLVFAVDASTWARCDAETSPERGFYYSASTHSAGKPIVAGWSYQWITQLDWAHNSWTAPTEVAPLFVFDAGYDAPALTDTLTGVDANLVVRIRDDRVFYTDPESTGDVTTGRPRRHGERRKCGEPATWPAPDEVSVSTDPRYGAVRASAWHLSLIHISEPTRPY